MTSQRSRRLRAAGLSAALISTAALTLSPAATAAVGSSELPDLTSNVPLIQMPSLLQDWGLGTIELTTPYEQEQGSIREGWGAQGPHAVTSTAVARECSDIFHDIYNVGLRYLHGLNGEAPCYGDAVRPEIVGSQLIYPADIASMDSAPLIVMSPGISTEPGMTSRQAERYASNGYVVALGYTTVNWFGVQLDLATAHALQANTDSSSELYQKIDTSRTLLVGHSAGGGSVARVSESLGTAVRQIADPTFQVRGTVAVNPGPADFGLASPASSVPQLYAIAENESLVPNPLSRLLYDRALGSKWWTVVKGAYHGTFLDDPDTNVYAGLVLSFGDYVLNHSAAATAVYEGGGLANDAELTKTEQVLK